MTDSGKAGEGGSAVTGLRKSRPCPMCDNPSSKEMFPFCSNRCKDLDLGRWLKGSYAIAAAEEDDPDEQDYAQIDQ